MKDWFVLDSDHLTKFKVLKITLVMGLIFITGIGFLFSLYHKEPILPTTKTTILFHIPNDFNVIYYDYDNLTEIVHYNYSVYMLSVGGREHENITIGHNQNFISQELLSWFLDIEVYNMTWYQDSFAFNQQTLNFSFTHNGLNQNFIFDAVDLSLWNGSTNLQSMDFGNTPFIPVSLGNVSHITLNNILCYRIDLNIYRPYLNYTVNNQDYLERMAWNNTLSL
jgi:hypothetical protein